MLRSDIVGHIMVNQRANYQLTAITLGMILLGGTILGSTPFAFADHDEDKKKKLKELLKKLKAKIRDHLDDDDDKCKEKKKYQGEWTVERLFQFCCKLPLSSTKGGLSKRPSINSNKNFFNSTQII